MLYSEFIASYPEFISVTKYPQSKVEAIIVDAESEINEDKWGIYYLRGVKALSGHLLSMWYMNTLSGGTGRADIVLVKDPEFYAEFQGRRLNQAKPDSLDRTEYGVEYQRLQKIVGYMQPRQSISLI